MSRLEFTKTHRYRKGVIIGNWLEEANSYKKIPQDLKSTYLNDFIPSLQSNDPNLIWDQRVNAQGLGSRVLFDHQGSLFLDNMSTTYDLAYNHFSKLCDGPIPRYLRPRLGRYDPQADFIMNFGNITKNGLRDYYQERWRCEIQDPRTTLTTDYQDGFVRYEKKDLVCKRKGIPRTNSSSMVQINNLNTRFRDKIIAVAPEIGLVTQVPQEPRCNPITWECADELKDPKKCVQSPKTKRKMSLCKVYNDLIKRVP